MSKYRYKILCLLLLAGAVVWFAWQETENRLTVINRSGQPIAALQITIADEMIGFTQVPAGQEVNSVFQIKAVDHFVLKGQFADGSIMTGDFRFSPKGTHGERVKFIIKRNGLIDYEASR